MAATEVASLGPSKIPKPSTHAYSGPERLTPRRRTGLPAPSTSWLPCTFTATVAAEAGRSTSTAPRAARASARARARATPPMRRDLYRRAATGFSPRLYRWGSSPLPHPGSRGRARVGGRDGRYSRAPHRRPSRIPEEPPCASLAASPSPSPPSLARPPRRPSSLPSPRAPPASALWPTRPAATSATGRPSTRPATWPTASPAPSTPSPPPARHRRSARRYRGRRVHHHEEAAPVPAGLRQGHRPCRPAAPPLRAATVPAGPRQPLGHERQRRARRHLPPRAYHDGHNDRQHRRG